MPFQIFSGVFETFAETGRSLDFFRSDFYLGRSRARLKKVMQAPAPVHDYTMAPIVTAFLAQQGALSVLDFGGGPGFSYLPLRDSLASKEGLTFHVLDCPEACKLGRENFADDPCISFFDNETELLSHYDVVHFGSVLQYVEDIDALAAFAKNRAARFILVSDAMVGTARTFVTVADYYGHLHPHRFHNHAEFVALFAAGGFDLVSSVGYVPNIRDQFHFYDMGNLPPECRTDRAYHLLFRSQQPSRV